MTKEELRVFFEDLKNHLEEFPDEVLILQNHNLEDGDLIEDGELDFEFDKEFIESIINALR